MNPFTELFQEWQNEDENNIYLKLACGGLLHLLSMRMDHAHKLLDLIQIECEDQKLQAPLTYCSQLSTILQPIHQTLGSITQSLTTLEGIFAPESYDLVPLIQGLSRKFQELSLWERLTNKNVPPDHRCFINGFPFLLQQGLLNLSRSIPEEWKGPGIFVLDRYSIDKQSIHLTGSHLSPQEYIVFQFLFHSDSSPTPWHHLSRFFFTLPERVQGCLIFLYGVMLIHQGDLWIQYQNNKILGLQCLFPTITPLKTSLKDQRKILGGHETLLLVDDESIIWDVVIDWLQQLGYRVILAENGVDCVEICKQNPGKIDLVLLDMVMPEMNGRDAFFAIRKIDPHIKVLVQSGYIHQQAAQEVLKAGANGFLQKPYQLSELAQKIRSILDSPSS